MMLQDKVAVIYGAGGAIGGAVARAYHASGMTGNDRQPEHGQPG
jgi:NAD(P)-dependent dehydrogenase (short-subunit alcohol dehydrogenase family)